MSLIRRNEEFEKALAEYFAEHPDLDPRRTSVWLGRAPDGSMYGIRHVTIEHLPGFPIGLYEEAPHPDF